jgi:alcohol dehydrogenase YqhD (iron-dependent ADH family)
MIALGVNRDHAEYMMGHKLSTYNTVKSLGIEYLRAVYLSSSLSIKPRTKQNKIDDINKIIRLWGLDPKEILSNQA